ncbi:N-acetylmuramic acid 6-phosphate etherase [Sciscionella sediminilitoris]|uniref:N-acetylmuramic acid 6-phosphate etherase n=1 Tax=Sciscionella sediminilitoris TaxID=1445613 RepID=UPI0004DEE2CA|nr:N-acetylmuramic acid 6-phosphate etherase [Sciscionella sp. SE31]
MPQQGAEQVRVEAPTEARNPRTTDIDQLSTVDVLRKINDEDALVPRAVAAVLEELAILVDAAVEAIRAGGRVHYVGAGTSGRLAVLDAAELVPTYNVPEDLFVSHHAGGAEALRTAAENVEDDTENGAAEIRESATGKDVVVGLAASGRTPYVLGALRAGRELGARTALISANPQAEGNALVDVALAVDTGPEVIAGSTRMKAGTAQKLILNAFSTAVMIKLGHTYSNFMVSMRATNAKLRGRTLRILQEATDADEQRCAEALAEADGDMKTALVTLLAEVSSAHASDALRASDGNVRKALAAL